MRNLKRLLAGLLVLLYSEFAWTQTNPGVVITTSGFESAPVDGSVDIGSGVESSTGKTFTIKSATGAVILNPSSGTVIIERGANDLTLDFTGALAAAANITFPTAGAALATLALAETFTNKTLSSPTFTGTVAGSPAASGSWTFSGAGVAVQVTNILEVLGKLSLGSASSEIEGTGTAMTVDVNNAAASTLTVTNQGAGVAHLNIAEGGLQMGGTEVISSARAGSFSSMTFSGTLDMATNLITNIGHNGTDFTAGGGLTLEEILVVNDDVDFVFSGTENLAITTPLVGSVDVVSVVATPSATVGTAQGLVIRQANAAGTNGLDVGIVVDNADDIALATGIQVLGSSTGTVTTAVDLTDAEIDTAFAVGTNNVTGTTGNIDWTNFDVTGSTGNVVTAGDLAVNGGDITTTATAFNVDLPASGGTIAFRDGTNNLMTVADAGTTGNVVVTGTATLDGNLTLATSGGSINSTGGGLTLGDGLQTVAVDGSDWDINGTGVGTGIDSIASTSGTALALTGTAAALNVTGNAVSTWIVNAAAAASPTTTLTLRLDDSDGTPHTTQLQIEQTGAAVANLKVDGTVTSGSSVTVDGTGATGIVSSTGALSVNPGGTFVLGDGGDTLSIDSSDWDVGTDGAFTGLASVATDTNQAAFTVNIPVTTPDATAHTISLQVDSYTAISAAATGDGAGGVGVATVSVGTGTAADVVTIGDANANVSVTDAQWSVTGVGDAAFAALSAAATTLTGILTSNTAGGTNLVIDEDSIERNSGAVETLAVDNTGAGSLDLNLADGALKLNSVVRISNAGAFTGDGANITALSGSNIATGTVADARLPTSLGAKTFTGAITSDTAAGTNLLITETGLDRSSAATETLSLDNTGVGVLDVDVVSGSLKMAGTARISSAGAFTGDGASITNLSGSNVATGTVADARLPTSLGAKTFTGAITSDTGVGTNLVLDEDSVERNSASAETLSVNNTGAGALDLDLVDGALKLGGATRISNAGVVTAASLNSGATTLTGALDMSAQVISNIGNAGTDFDASGGLALASTLTLTNNTLTCTACIDGTDIAADVVDDSELVNALIYTGALTLTPGTTSDFVVNADADSNVQVSYASASDTSVNVLDVSLNYTGVASTSDIYGVRVTNVDSVAAGIIDALLVLQNLDTGTAVPAALKILSSGGGFTTVIDNQGTLLSGAELNLLDAHDVALVDTNDVVNTAITGTGALGAGSIAAGFGAIDVGADAITTTGTVSGGTLATTNNILSCTACVDATDMAADSVDDSELVNTLTYTGQLTLTPGAATDFLFNGDGDSNAQFATTTGDDTITAWDFKLTANGATSANTLYGLQVTNVDNLTALNVPDAIVRIVNENAAETVSRGLVIDHTGAGTLTAAIEIKESAGVVTDGIVITGTLGNIINSGSIDIAGDGTITGVPSITTSCTGCLTDANVSDTLTASLFVGSGSTSTAVDLATAEVAGTLPVANGGTASTTSTGTGSVVLQSGPTITGTGLILNTGAGVDLTLAEGTFSVNDAAAQTLAINNAGAGNLDLNLQDGALKIAGSAGTSTQTLHGGAAPSWAAVSLTADVSGTLGTANGGTGNTALTFPSGTKTVPGIQDANTWTGIQTFNPGTTPGDAVFITIARPTSAGTRNSNELLLRGTSFDTAGHDADWQQRVSVTSNAAASTYILESQIDAAGFTTRLSVTDAGALTVASLDLTSGQLAIADGGTGSSTSTGTGSVVLQTNPTLAGALANADVDFTFLGAENFTITSDLNTAAVDVLSIVGTPSGTANTARGIFIQQANHATNTNGLDVGVLIDNADTDLALAAAVQVTGSSTGAVTTAFDASDAEIVTALAIGTNDITTGAATIASTELDRLDGKDAALVDTNDAVGTAITGTGALASGSIASGFGTISTSNTITGTTLNGTTALNTGAGAGTNRVDVSGNLVNIGNITATAGVTIASSGAGNNVIINGANILDVQDNATFAGSLDANQQTTFTPTLTADVVFTLDNDSNIQVNPTITSDVAINSLAVTYTDNALGATATRKIIDVVNADNSTNTGVPNCFFAGTNNNAAETMPLGIIITQSGAGVLTTAVSVTRNAGTVTTAYDVTGQVGTVLKVGTTPATAILDTLSADISAAGALSGLTGLAVATGTITFSPLNSAGALLQVDGNGVVSAQTVVSTFGGSCNCNTAACCANKVGYNPSVNLTVRQGSVGVTTAGSGGTTNAIVKITCGVNNADITFACNAVAGIKTTDFINIACAAGTAITVDLNSVGDCTPGPTIQEVVAEYTVD